MKLFFAIVVLLFSMPASCQSEKKAVMQQSDATQTRSMLDDIRAVSPVLERYTRDRLLGDLWKRPDLSTRDRSIVTPGRFDCAESDSADALLPQSRPRQWGQTWRDRRDHHASRLLLRLGECDLSVRYHQRGIPQARDWTRSASAGFHAASPLDEAAEKQRATSVERNFGVVAPGIVQYTTHVLFRDLWLRPALAPRDRSLVTVSALIASGQVAQVSYHLNKAMDNGLTQREAAEMLTQLAFYAGWPNVFSALPVAKEVFEKRPK
jgi:4-carboxymuconolactone decarboxylase